MYTSKSGLSWCPICRPLKAQVYNCQLLVDLAGRNAVWGAAAHLFEAFRPLQSPHNPPAAALAHSPAQNPHLLRAASGLQRGGSGVSPVGPRKAVLGAAPAAAKLPSQNSLAQGKTFLCAHAAFINRHMFRVEFPPPPPPPPPPQHMQ